MIRFAPLALFGLVACSKTLTTAPGQPADDSMVVTYYYLKF
jgi:hypothetical protein